MSNPTQSQEQPAAVSKEEQEELKTLQEKRKETGGHMTDSERVRLSELQHKAKPPAAAKGTTTTTTPTKEDKFSTGKK